MAEQAVANRPSPAAGGTVVVGPQYCAPYPVEVVIKRKIFRDRRLEVTNANGDLLFKIESQASCFRYKRVILDAAGNVILTLQPKHGRWEVFRGASSERRDLTFTTKIYSLWRMNLKVYFMYNTREELCDFKVKTSGKSCVVYAGESNSTIVAQMQTKQSFCSYKVIVTMCPNIDHAFIVALFAILDAMKSRGAA